MDWVVVFLVAGAAIAVWRIIYNVRNTSKSREDDWDARMIERLRRSGIDPFKPVDVDFFLAVPSKDRAESMASRLRSEGFETDIRELRDSVDQTWSVHALKNMSLNVHGMREVSTRLRQLADEVGGRYDGWAPGPDKPTS